MNLNILILNGYGAFVWSAFIFTFVSCLVLYLKTKRELKRHEVMFINEFHQLPEDSVKVAKHKETSREVLSGKIKDGDHVTVNMVDGRIVFE